MTPEGIILLSVSISLIFFILFILGKEIIKRDNRIDSLESILKEKIKDIKYLSQKQEFDGQNFSQAIELNLLEQERLEKELKKYKARASYRIKRINTLEGELAEATGDKKILRGRKLIK